MSLLERAAAGVTARALAWAILLVLLLAGLLVISIIGNLTQWADHRAYVKSEQARLEAAASKAGLQVSAVIAARRQKDDPKLQETIDRVEGKVDALKHQRRPPALPAQCAPGQQRMDAVNAGADARP